MEIAEPVEPTAKEPADSAVSDAHNAMIDYAIWKGTAEPRPFNTVVSKRTRDGEIREKKTIVTTPHIDHSGVALRRTAFVRRVRDVLATVDLKTDETPADALRKIWESQKYDPDVITAALAAYAQAEEENARAEAEYRGLTTEEAA